MSVRHTVNTLMSLIDVEFIFIWCDARVQLHSSTLVVPAPVFEKFFPPLNCFGTPVKNQLTIIYGPIFRLLTLSH